MDVQYLQFNNRLTLTATLEQSSFTVVLDGLEAGKLLSVSSRSRGYLELSDKVFCVFANDATEHCPFTFTNFSLMKALVLSVDQPWRSRAYGPWNVICMGFLHCDSFARQDQRHAIFADFVALELLPKDLPSWNMPCFS